MCKQLLHIQCIHIPESDEAETLEDFETSAPPFVAECTDTDRLGFPSTAGSCVAVAKLTSTSSLSLPNPMGSNNNETFAIPLTTRGKIQYFKSPCIRGYMRKTCLYELNRWLYYHYHYHYY